MMQSISDVVNFPVDNSAPVAAGDGTDVSQGAADGAGNFRLNKHLVTATVTGGTSLEFILYALISGVWGKVCDVGNPDGFLGGTALTPGVRHFELEHVGVATRLALVKGTSLGGSTGSATLALVRERNR